MTNATERPGGESGQTQEVILSHATLDPERRLSMPSGRFTGVGNLLALIIALLLTVAFFAALNAAPESPVKDSLTRPSSQHVPAAIVALTLWCLVILTLKWLKIRIQRRALSLRLSPDDPTFVLSPTTASDVLERMHALVDEPNKFLLCNRIQIALANLKNMMRLSDVGEVLASQEEADYDVMESSYTVLRGLLWMIPILGFVGTVLGLATGIGKFGAVLDAASDVEELKGALREVTAGLATAFETTLQGLLAALLVHFLMTMVRRSEESLLHECHEYCQRHVVGRLRMSPTDPDD